MICFLLWVISFSGIHQSLAYYDSSYSRYRFGSQTTQQVISIDLNPKHLINTSFRVAAREDRLSDMEEMIREGADVDSASTEGETALMYAARNCSTPIVQELLRLKVDVNIKNHDGDTALVYATIESCLPVVRLLLKSHHLEIFERDRSGKTALDYAAEGATLEVDGPAAQILHLLERRLRPRTHSKRATLTGTK